MSEQEELEKQILQEFLIESAENLATLDREMVELEERPNDADLLASVFRTIHTVKGTCGFFGYTRLGAVAHLAENILSELRSNNLALTTELSGLILEAVDAIKRILGAIESGEGEGAVFEEALLIRLRQALEPRAKGAAIQAPATVSPDKPVPESKSLTESSLRINVEILDRLMNLVGELVLTRNQLLQFGSARSEDERDEDPLHAISQRLNLITSELQEGVMKTRMQPIGVVWNKLPRVVRDLAANLGKKITLEMEGSETELDRAIIEAIKDPMTHIVRNSCDHGIESPEERKRCGKSESGKLLLRAFHEGGKVHLEITDDGAGIDPKKIRDKAVERGLITAEHASRISDHEAVNMVFLPGFSLAKSVTSVSGRGVGMDVVKTNVERIGGVLDLVSLPGKGTSVRVTIPLTLAIMPGLIVQTADQRFVIPQADLHEVIWLEGEESLAKIDKVHSTQVYRQRDGLLPLTDLADILGKPPAEKAGERCIVTLQAGGRKFGLMVDRIHDTEEIVVKPLGPLFEEASCFSGATIMGDGSIALILDATDLGVRSGLINALSELATGSPEHTETAMQEKPVQMLVVRAGRFNRLAIPLSRVARLERIPHEDVEYAAGREVVQYREQILPLISLAEMLSPTPVDRATPETLDVVVCNQNANVVGIVVDEVVDAVDEIVRSSRGERTRGLLGSAVLENQVTDFVDLDAVINWGSPAVDQNAQRDFVSVIGNSNVMIGER